MTSPLNSSWPARTRCSTPLPRTGSAGSTFHGPPCPFPQPARSLGGLCQVSCANRGGSSARRAHRAGLVHSRTSGSTSRARRLAPRVADQHEVEEVEARLCELGRLPGTGRGCPRDEASRGLGPALGGRRGRAQRREKLIDEPDVLEGHANASPVVNAPAVAAACRVARDRRCSDSGVVSTLPASGETDKPSVACDRRERWRSRRGVLPAVA